LLVNRVRKEMSTLCLKMYWEIVACPVLVLPSYELTCSNYIKRIDLIKMRLMVSLKMETGLSVVNNYIFYFCLLYFFSP